MQFKGFDGGCFCLKQTKEQIQNGIFDGFVDIYLIFLYTVVLLSRDLEIIRL